MTEPIYGRAANLLEAELGDELVALDASAGNCFGFNGAAASVWRLLIGPKSLAQLIESLTTEYDVSSEQCSAELKILLDELIELGLVNRIA